MDRLRLETRLPCSAKNNKRCNAQNQAHYPAQQCRDAVSDDVAVHRADLQHGRIDALLMLLVCVMLRTGRLLRSSPDRHCPLLNADIELPAREADLPVDLGGAGTAVRLGFATAWHAFDRCKLSVDVP